MRPTAYRRNARGLRDRLAFEGVRMQAGTLFAAALGSETRTSCRDLVVLVNQTAELVPAPNAGAD